MALNGKLIKRRDIHMENMSETKKRLTVGKVKRHIKEAKEKGVKELLDVGFTHQEIAKILAIPESSIRSLSKNENEEDEEPP